MTESWKPVTGYEGLYEVSDQGRVRSLDRVIAEKSGKTRRFRGRELKTQIDSAGYSTLQLWRDNRCKLRRVHTIVAEAFLGTREGLVTRHLDGNPQNNSLINLAYGTQSDNERDCYSYGGRKGNGKLYADQVLEIRKRLEHGDTCTALAADYGVCIGTISCIKTGAHFSYLTEVDPANNKTTNNKENLNNEQL